MIEEKNLDAEDNEVSKTQITETSNQGFSNAPTYSSLGYQVDPRTGTLQVTISPTTLSGFLGESITPSIVYTPQSIESGNSLLGLPLGWSYLFSYIAFSQVFINGSSSYYIDDLYDSGLRYYNLKNLIFTNDSGKFPYDNNLKYVNTLKFISGEIQYFDANGRLIGIEDRWSNHVIFYYNRDGDVYNSKLSRIVNSYNKDINFTYPTEGIKITYPQGGSNNIEFTYLIDTDNYLIGYINPIGQEFKIINKGGLVRNDLISQIIQPNGLTINYNYTTIRYYTDSRKSQFRRSDVIAMTEETYTDSSGASQTRTVSYNSDPNGDAHNYTGYPTYAMGRTTDTLLQSYDNDYRYLTRVDDGVLVTEHHYNRLHLELETNVFTKDITPILIQKVINTFKSETDGQNFPPYNELKLIPNYQTPIRVVTNVYNDAGDKLTNQIESDFDDYGSPTEIRSYKTTVGDESLALLDKVQITYDNLHYGQVIQKDSYDYTDTTLANPIIRRVINSLTSDNKNIGTSIDGFVVSLNGKDTFNSDKKITYRYNTSGKIIFEKLEWDDAEVHSLQSTETSTNYSVAYPLLTITVTNAQGISSSTIVDTTTGWIISQINALNYSVKYSYDNIGRKLVVIDQFGVATKLLFEDAINKVTTQYANGYETYIYNNGFGNPIKASDNAGSNQKERTLKAAGYNNEAQLIWTEGILGINSRIKYEYNNRNQLFTTTDAFGNISRYEYEPCNQIKTEYFNNVKITALKKDNSILQEKIFSSLSPTDLVTTISSYDVYSKVIQSNLGNKSSGEKWLETSYQYDVHNKVNSYSITGSDKIIAYHSISRDLFTNSILESVSVTTPEKISSIAKGDSYNYNNLNQLVIVTNTLNQNYIYTYNEVGLVSSYKDYAGTVFTYKYYANNQLASIEWSDKSHVQFKTEYTYYPLTYQLQYVEEFYNSISRGRIEYSYNFNGTIKSITYPDGKQILYEYDDQTGLLIKFTDIAKKVTQYSYDNYGRVVKQQIIGTNYSLIVVYYNKDESSTNSGKIKSIKVSNGILNSYTYDGFGSILQTNITDSTINGSDNILLNTQYSYDPTTRNIITVKCISTISKQDPNLNYSTNYSYNSLNQLIEERVQDIAGKIRCTTYMYDAASNVVQEDYADSIVTNSTIYTYDLDNKLLNIKTSAGTRNLVYDVNGNLLDNGQGCIYGYDAQNKLISYSDSINNLHAEYNYYPNGLRASKKINNNDVIQFYYDSSQYPNIINETQGGKTSSYLIMNSVRYIRLVDSKAITTPEYFIESFKDIVGVVNDSNKIDATYSYDPYGHEEKFVSTNSDISINPFRYTAEYTDMESGLIYLRSRYYNPEIKRFMSRDKTTLLNRYNYANGNPVMSTDPSGDMGIGWIIGAAIAGIAVGLVTGGVGAALLGTGLGASIAVGTVAGVAGTAASNGITEWGRHASGESGLTGKDWGISLLAGAAAGAVGARVGGAVGRSAMGRAMNAGWSAGSVTAVGVLSASASGGFTGSVASAGITSGFNNEKFFSSDVWKNIGISTVVGMGAGVMASGAHFGSGRLGTVPVEMAAGDINSIPEIHNGNRIIDLNPSEVSQWNNKPPQELIALTGGQDTVIVHGHPRFAFPEDIQGRPRYASANTIAEYLGQPGRLGGGGGQIRLISCYAGRNIGVNNMAQTIATALGRPVEAYSVAISIDEVIAGIPSRVFQP